MKMSVTELNSYPKKAIESEPDLSVQEPDSSGLTAAVVWLRNCLNATVRYNAGCSDC